MKPIISAIMPTANRAAFVPGAIKCFLSQTFEARELIILDSGDSPVSHLVPDDPRIRYFRICAPGITLGAKRNGACEFAAGSYLMNWDDDDWSHPSRMERQLNTLLDYGVSMTGYHRFFYWDMGGKRAYEYIYQGHGHYASGSTQFFARSWWEQHKYKHVNHSEDSDFAFTAAKAGELHAVPGGNMIVARAHSANTWKQQFGGSGFRMVETELLPAEFRAEIGVAS